MWFSVTPLQVAQRTRLLGHHDRRRGVPRLRRRHRRQLHRSRPPEGRRGHRRDRPNGSSTPRSTSTSTTCSSRWRPSWPSWRREQSTRSSSPTPAPRSPRPRSSSPSRSPSGRIPSCSVAASTAAPIMAMAMTTSKTGVSRRARATAVRCVRRPVPRSAGRRSGRRGGRALAGLRPSAEDDDRARRDRGRHPRTGARRGRIRPGARRRSWSASVERCRQHGILFIADEVQSGFGRTGKMFAVEHYGIEPDIICMAKGIASGFPVRRPRHPARTRRQVAHRQSRRHLWRQPDGLRGGAGHDRDHAGAGLPRKRRGPRRATHRRPHANCSKNTMSSPRCAGLG